MPQETKYTCDECGQEISPPVPRIDIYVIESNAAGEQDVKEMTFHSYEHLVNWAQTKPV